MVTENDFINIKLSIHMKNIVLYISFCIFAFSSTCKASEENTAHNERQIINTQWFRNIRPVIFSHLDEPSARAARLVCNKWNETLADQTFDEKNPHLNLPYSKAKKLIDGFKDEAMTPSLDCSYKYILRNSRIMLKRNDLVFSFKVQFLLCPNKNIRKIAYTKLYEKHSSLEHLFLFLSYTPKDQITLEQNNLLLGQLKIAARDYDEFIHDKYQNIDEVKEYFSPANFSLIKNEANSNEDRNPIEIRSLALHKEAMYALKWHKVHKKCCKIHEQGKKIAHVVSIMSLFALIARVYFNI